MKKFLPMLSLMAAMTLVACGPKDTSSKAANTSKQTTSQKSSSKASSAASSKSATPSTSAAPVHEHTWTPATDGVNSDGQVIKNYTCTCGAKAAGIALTDCVADDAGNIAADGKIKLSSTTRWKIVAPKAGTATLMMAAKLSSAFVDAGSPSDTAFMNTYEIKAGDTAGEVTFIGKTYTGDLGFNDTDLKYYEVGTLTVAEGENVISFTTPSQQYYRLCNGGEVRLVFAA